MTPSNAGGRPIRPRSQPSVTSSSSVDAGDVFHNIACWLRAAASISPSTPGGLAELAK